MMMCGSTPTKSRIDFSNYTTMALPKCHLKDLVGNHRPERYCSINIRLGLPTCKMAYWNDPSEYHIVDISLDKARRLIFQFHIMGLVFEKGTTIRCVLDLQQKQTKKQGPVREIFTRMKSGFRFYHLVKGTNWHKRLEENSERENKAHVSSFYDHGPHWEILSLDVLTYPLTPKLEWMDDFHSAVEQRDDVRPYLSDAFFKWYWNVSPEEITEWVGENNPDRHIMFLLSYHTEFSLELLPPHLFNVPVRVPFWSEPIPLFLDYDRMNSSFEPYVTNWNYNNVHLRMYLDYPEALAYYCKRCK